MSRSVWKNLKILKKKQLNLTGSIKVWQRSSLITSSLIGKTIFVYNGKIFKKIIINREKIGYKFGEFSGTRNYKILKKKPIKSSKR